MQIKKTLVPIKSKTNSVSVSVSGNRNENQNGKNSDSSMASNQRVPFGEIERNSNYQQCNRSSYTESYTEMPPKFMRTNDHEMIPNNSAMVQKENVNMFGKFANVRLLFFLKSDK